MGERRGEINWGQITKDLECQARQFVSCWQLIIIKGSLIRRHFFFLASGWGAGRRELAVLFITVPDPGHILESP